MKPKIIQSIKKLYRFECLLKCEWIHEIDTTTPECQAFIKSAVWETIPHILTQKRDPTDPYVRLRKTLHEETRHIFDRVVRMVPTFYVPSFYNKYSINTPLNQHHDHLMEFWKFYVGKAIHASTLSTEDSVKPSHISILTYAPVKSFQRFIRRKQQNSTTTNLQQHKQSQDYYLLIPNGHTESTETYCVNGVSFYGKQLNHNTFH